jgi:hypothetical protein
VNGPEIITDIKHQFASAIGAWDTPPFEPLVISPWLAAALLQKSIRRGEENFALHAAATLLQIAPDRLWRRCGGIAAEDVGLGNIDVVAIVTAALSGKRFRAGFDGEWRVASFIVNQMANATKCRASDDLLMCAERHPSLAHARREFSMLSTRELLSIATGSASLPERALATWYGLGTGHRPSPWLQPRRGDPNVVFDALCEAGLPHSIVEIGRELFRRAGEPLGPFLSLLCPQREAETATVADDDIPPETMIGQLPSWAFDRYSREGLACLQLFLRGNTETARWVCAHIRATKRVDFIGDVLFRVEGQISRQRIRWHTATELQRLVDVECAGHGCADATEILGLMRADLPALNDVCVELLGGRNHV